MIEKIFEVTGFGSKGLYVEIDAVDRIIRSLDKLLKTFSCESGEQNANNGIEQVRRIHIQLIENFYFENPHIFEKSNIEEFHRMKDALDLRELEIMSLEEKHKDLILCMKEHFTEKKTKLRKDLKSYKRSFYYLFIGFIFVSASILYNVISKSINWFCSIESVRYI